MTTTVWWTGPGERVMYAQDWQRLGITADTVEWNADNGWAVPQSAFTQPQLNVLQASADFLLDQVGPRVNPPPSTAAEEDDSGFYYYAQMKALFDALPNQLATATGKSIAFVIALG
jgi:hypothetical protein